MRHKALKAVSAVLLAGVASTFMTAPAHAAEYLMFTDDDGHPGGSVKFTAKGDRVHLCNLDTNGPRVWLRVKNVTKDPDRREYPLQLAVGPACIDVNAAMKQPYNLAEKHCFRFTIWLEGDYAGSVDWAQWRNYNDDGAKNCDGVD